MNKGLQTALSLFLCLILIISFYFSLASLFLSHTLFSVNFYQRVTAAPAYLPLVLRSINNDLLTQSNFVAIPFENLQAGLDEQLVYVRLRHHVQNTVAFLNYETDFSRATYPEEIFYEELTAFIASHAQQEGYTPSQEQYALLAEVSADSAEIVARHINVLNLDLVRDMSAFQRLHLLLYRLSRLFWPAALTWFLTAVLLALLHWKTWRRGLLFGLTALWLAGSLLLIPALVLEIFALPRRLAIETPYLQYAVDHLLTFANRYFLSWGLLVVLLASAGLIARIMLDRPRRRSR